MLGVMLLYEVETIKYLSAQLSTIRPKTLRSMGPELQHLNLKNVTVEESHIGWEGN